MAKIIHDLSLLDIAPPSIGNDKTVKSIITAINPELKSVSEAISDAFIISRINQLPEHVIDLLAWQWHVDFYEPDLDIATKRALVLNSIKYHKKKGTKYAIKTALEALGFVPVIKEWFEPDMGTPAHTFSITGHYKDDEINVDFLGEDTEEILKRVVEITKPVRSSLIYLLIAPTPMDLSEHICRWDVCTWEHGITKIYDWGLLTPEPSIFDDNPVIKRVFDNNLFTIHDSAFWDFNTWGGVPVRNLLVGSCSENAIIASLEWGDGEYSTLFPAIWDGAKWDYAATFTRSIGSVLARDFDLNFDLDAIQQVYFAISEHKILYDNRPSWDNQTWLERDKWVDDLARDILQESSFQRGFFASLSVPNNHTWNTILQWREYGAWNNCEIKTSTIEPTWQVYAEDEANSKQSADFWIGVTNARHILDASLDSDGLSVLEFIRGATCKNELRDVLSLHSYNHNLEIFDYSEPAYLDKNLWDNTRVNLSEISAEWLICKREQQEIINGVAFWDVNNWDN